MKMKTEIIVFAFDHYEMDNNRGLNVRMLGEHVNTNNKEGMEIAKVPVPYTELEYLQAHSVDLPARFSAEMGIVTIKDRSGNEKGGFTLSNLEFINSVELVDKSMPAAKK